MVSKEREAIVDAVMTRVDALGDAIKAGQEAKGMHLQDAAERRAVTDALPALRKALVPLAYPEPPGRDAGIAQIADYTHCMRLSWKQDDEDEPDGSWELYDGGRLAGEIYPVEGGYRMHCKRTDWRLVLPTLREAKDELVIRYVTDYAQDARTIVWKAGLAKPGPHAASTQA